MAANLLGLMLSLSLVSRWVERRAVHVRLGEATPIRWLLWGSRQRDGQGRDWFVVLRLPSYHWCHDEVRDVLCWHQRVVC